MRKVAPSVMAREELDRLLAGGVDEGTNISEVVATATRLVVQSLLEAEQADFLGGRGRYQSRDDEAGHRGWRNGYEDRNVATGEGRIGVRVPQVRDTGVPFRSTLMGFLESNSEILERLVNVRPGIVHPGRGGRFPGLHRRTGHLQECGVGGD